MKQIIRDWLVGALYLSYILFAAFCMAAGFGLVMLLEYPLEHSGWNVPYYVFLISWILYAVLFCPYFLASYVRYFGLVPNKKEQVL